MRFWDEMQAKSGFSDGESVPEGADVYREVYIRAINRLAEQRGSTVRAVAYDRPGMHNWCLVTFRVAGTPDGTEVLPDDQMDTAIEQALDLDLDGFVPVVVAIHADFARFLADLTPD